MNKTRHTIDTLFVITLFFVFAFSVVVLTGIGANVYSNVVTGMGENYNSRATFTYVYNKIHQSDKNGAISIGEYCGYDALVISEEIDNVPYCTYLYSCDDELKEMFTRQGQNFDPSFGTKILDIESFEIEKVSDALYRFDITPKGSEKESLFVHIRSKE